MLTNCPKCKKVISVEKTGNTFCPKCGTYIFVGDPIKDEENKVLFNPEEELKKEIEAFETEKLKKPKKKDEEEKNKKETIDIDYIKETYLKNSEIDEKDYSVGVPWDNLTKIGFTNAVFDTIKEMIFTPTKFFENMILIPVKKFIPLIGILFSIAGSIFYYYWIIWGFNKYYSVLEQSLPAEKLAKIHLPQGGELVFTVLVSPIVQIIFVAIMLHIISLFMGFKTRQEHFYRLVGFVSILDFLYIIPGFGIIIVWIWKSILLIKGLKVINEIPTLKAISIYSMFFMFLIMFSLFFGGF